MGLARLGYDFVRLTVLAGALATAAPGQGSGPPHQDFLRASNPYNHALFGAAIAVSGDTAVIGAHGESSAATGVNGDPTGYVSKSGAAYVFERHGDAWVEVAFLKASNTGEYDYFGKSVAISGDTIVVGAPEESSSATGVNGDQLNDDLDHSGAAYVFVRDQDGLWSQQAYLKASNTGHRDEFGLSVGVSGDRIVVGAYSEDSGATGVNGNQGNNSENNSGAAYVFVRDGAGTWSQEAYLKASNSDGTDEFGWSVAISGMTVAVGAPSQGPAPGGVYDSGAAYVFRRSAGTWTEEAFLKAPHPDIHDAFGYSVALSGNLLAVGMPYDGSSATTIGGDPTDNSVYAAGAVYAFRYTSGVWSESAYLKAPIAEHQGRLGWAVAVSGNRVLGGTRWLEAGVVFRGNGPWALEAHLEPPVDIPDEFGVGVGLSGDNLLVGAPRDDVSGAVYTYDFRPDLGPGGYCYGTSCPCGNGDPTGGCASSAGHGAELLAEGSNSVSADDLTLYTVRMPPNSPGLYLFGPNAIGVSFGDGRRCVGGALRRFFPFVHSDTNGTARLGPGIPAHTWSQFPPSHHIAVGSTWYFQAWYRDGQGPCGAGFNLSNGLGVTFAP